MDAAGLDSSRLHALGVGQVAEWLVWTRLVATSDGDLHVFLPLDDRGVDGIVHRISTDEFARVQVKARTRRHHRGINIQVRADELEDDLSIVVAVLVDLAVVQLAPYALACPAPAFRDLAHRHVYVDRTTYQATLPLAPDAQSPWAPWCVPVDAIGERLLPLPRLAPQTAETEGQIDTVARKRRGYRAEMELLRRAAGNDRLNVFKAFPDLEPNEYLLYDIVSRVIVGMQVKSVTFAAAATEASVSVYRPALRPSPRTWFLIFLHAEGEEGFLPDCILVPSAVLAQSLRGHAQNGQLLVTRHVTGRLAPWRVALAGLGEALGTLTAGSPTVPGHN